MLETPDLSKKTIRPERIAELAIENDVLLQALLQGISPDTKRAPIRENSSQAVMFMAENWPEVLLPYWSYFVELLKSNNGFSKYAAIYIITSLAQVDKQGLFEKAFDTYYGLLDDESVMVAAHAAGNSGKLALAKPALQSKITRRLLAIEKTHFEPSRQDLIKGYIIQAFEAYIQDARDAEKILAFVEHQVNCASIKTRKLAKAFLKKWRSDVKGSEPLAQRA